MKQIKFAQALTSDTVKISFSVSFEAGKKRETIELKDMNLIKRGDLKEWFRKNILTLLMNKIKSHQGPIRFINFQANCSLKRCQPHTETPAEARRREWCRRNL